MGESQCNGQEGDFSTKDSCSAATTTVHGAEIPSLGAPFEQ